MNDLNFTNRTPIFAIASGKGGVGKTSISLNLAMALTNADKRVLIFDGDLGLGNVDVQLGLTPKKDLSHVIAGMSSLEDVMQRSEKGFYVIPGRSGNEKLPFLNALERRDILRKLRDLAGSFDATILDVAAGVNEEVLGLTSFADFTVLIVTPDPSSITDAYAVAKLLKNRHNYEKCIVLVNQASSEHEGKQTYEKIKTAAKKFLDMDLPLLGILPYERDYSASVKLQKILVNAFPNSSASKTVENIAKKLMQLGQDS